jgi:hypothetical protein
MVDRGTVRRMVVVMMMAVRIVVVLEHGGMSCEREGLGGVDGLVVMRVLGARGV